MGNSSTLSVSCLVVPDSLLHHGLQPTRLLCPWDFPGKDTGVGCHFLLQGIFPTQGSNPGLLHCRQILYQLSFKGSPIPHCSEIHILSSYYYKLDHPKINTLFLFLSLSRFELYPMPLNFFDLDLIRSFFFYGFLFYISSSWGLLGNSLTLSFPSPLFFSLSYFLSPFSSLLLLPLAELTRKKSK